MSTILYHSLGRPIQRFLVVTIAERQYGIPNRIVRAVSRAPVTNTSAWQHAHVEGMIPLAGRLVPVVNLHRKYGLPEAECEPMTVVVVQVRVQGHPVIPVGVKIDRVGEIVQIGSEPGLGDLASETARPLPCFSQLRPQGFPILDCDTAVTPLFSADRFSIAA